MHVLPDDQFAQLVAEAMDELPEKVVAPMSNVAVTYEDEPSAEQREKLRLRGDQTLFGLYEGIPLTARGGAYSMVLPDKITLFKLPLTYASKDIIDLKDHIKHTLWHEIAHHFGLDHGRIHELDGRRK